MNFSFLTIKGSFVAIWFEEGREQKMKSTGSEKLRTFNARSSSIIFCLIIPSYIGKNTNLPHVIFLRAKCHETKIECARWKSIILENCCDF